MAKIEVDKKEWEAMKEEIANLKTAALRMSGMDPAIAARQQLPRKMVQFTDNYSRGAVPSKIQKGANVFEAYSVKAGDIVYLREDEIERLKRDFPGGKHQDKRSGDEVTKRPLLITDGRKFEDQRIARWTLLDEKGNRTDRYRRDDEVVEVKTLKERAEDLLLG